MDRATQRANIKARKLAERDYRGQVWGIYNNSYLKDANPNDVSMQEIVDQLNYIIYILYKNGLIK